MQAKRDFNILMYSSQQGFACKLQKHTKKILHRWKRLDKIGNLSKIVMFDKFLMGNCFFLHSLFPIPLKSLLLSTGGVIPSRYPRG